MTPTPPEPTPETKLLPCPFCGEAPTVDCAENHSEHGGPYKWLVCCGSSHCYGNAFSLDDAFHSKKHACEAWNTRATHPSPACAEAAARATRKIYVASSWRNPYQEVVVACLRGDGHEVYDFKNPRPGDRGFSWAEIDPNWQKWTADEYIAALQHPIAKAGFASDFNAMKWANTFVLVLPCGRSAHLELGWAAGQGKETLVLTRNGEEPELMASMCDHICPNLETARDILRHCTAHLAPASRAHAHDLEQRLSAMQNTITACEHEVAKVYSDLTNGRFAKMNTRAEVILDCIRQIHEAHIDVESEEVMFTSETVDGEKEYRPTEAAEELFAGFCQSSNISSNVPENTPMQREAYMAGLLEASLRHPHPAPPLGVTSVSFTHLLSRVCGPTTGCGKVYAKTLANCPLCGKATPAGPTIHDSHTA